MRIISGTLKGRRFEAPASLPVRPTTDMAKEGLFNYLASRVDFEGIAVLDLFTGTGNLSYELISRGAASVVAVDKHPGCVRFVQEQFRNLGFREGRVFNTDVFIAVERSRDTFDLIVADPPYDFPRHAELIRAILEKGLLKPEAWLVMEHPGTLHFELIPGFVETRHYGKVHFSFFTASETTAL